jgi:transcriptional regulator GlxA family with amidase domain
MKITPAKFVERLRVETARRRLEESQNTLETIARECGFRDVDFDAQCFPKDTENRTWPISSPLS